MHYRLSSLRVTRLSTAADGTGDRLGVGHGLGRLGAMLHQTFCQSSLYSFPVLSVLYGSQIRFSASRN